jgi:hypothetical protein
MYHHKGYEVAHQYRVTGWIVRRAGERAYWAEFGYYATVEAARIAVQAVSRPGCVLTITVSGQTIATYQDGEQISDLDELGFLDNLVRA